MCPLRALVIDDESAARGAAETILAKAGYRVEVALDAKAGWAAIERETPDVVLIDGGLAANGTVDVVRKLRKLETRAHSYVIVGLDKTGVDLVGAYSAGADDVIRKPYGRDELVARVDGAKRLRQIIAKLSANAAVMDWSEGVTITSLDAWTQLDTAVVVDLEAMFGAAPRVIHGAGIEATSVGAQIPLSLPSEHLEVRMCVAFDDASIRAVATTLLGEEGTPDSRQDVAREIANLAGGALRRQAQKEGVTLTIGLPADVDPCTFPSAGQRAVRKFRMQLESGAFLAFEIEVTERAPELVQIGNAREGMVLAKDIMNSAGVLLIPGGTRLTTTVIARITQLLGPRHQVEVADAVAQQDAERKCA